MGAILGKENAKFNVFLMGMQDSGKTHFLYNGLLEEGWQEFYRKGPDIENKNSINMKRCKNVDKKYVQLEQTLGFNCEII